MALFPEPLDNKNYNLNDEDTIYHLDKDNKIDRKIIRILKKMFPHH